MFLNVHFFFAFRDSNCDSSEEELVVKQVNRSTKTNTPRQHAILQNASHYEEDGLVNYIYLKYLYHFLTYC